MNPPRPRNTRETRRTSELKAFKILGGTLHLTRFLNRVGLKVPYLRPQIQLSAPLVAAIDAAYEAHNNRAETSSPPLSPSEMAKECGMADMRQMLNRLSGFGIELLNIASPADTLTKEQVAAIRAAFAAYNNLPAKRGRGRPRRSASSTTSD
jgi:hypothetical protein